MPKETCHRLSPQVRRQLAEFDDVQLKVILHHMRRLEAKASASPTPRMSPPIALDRYRLHLAWRYTGEQTPNCRRVVMWDWALLIPQDKRETFFQRFREHLLAAATVSALGGSSAFAAQQFWPSIKYFMINFLSVI